MCSPSPPPPPDFTGAANAQGAANRETALTQGHINNPNVINPFGRQTVTWNGEQPTVTQELSPEQQALLDQRNQTQELLGGLAQQGAGSLQGLLGTQVDFSGLPQRPTALGYPASTFTPSTPTNPATRGPGLPPIRGGPGGGPQNHNPASRGPFFPSSPNGGDNPALAGPGHNFGQGTPVGTNPAARGVPQGPTDTPPPPDQGPTNPALGGRRTFQAAGDFVSAPPVGNGTDDFAQGGGNIQPDANAYGGIPIPQVGKTPDALNPNRLPGMEGPLDSNQLPYVGTADQVRQQVIDAMMGRANQDLEKTAQQKQSDLIAAGIRPGTEAYQREMDLLGRQKNDALQQAQIAGGNAAAQQFGMDLSRRQQATGEQGQSFQQATSNRGMSAAEQQQAFQQLLSGGAQRFGQQGQVAQLLQGLQGQGFGQQSQSRRDAIAELLAQRQTPLNEISTLMGGSGVSNPFSVPNYNGNTSVAPPPVFGGAQAQGNYANSIYNAQVGSANQTNSAIAGLGSAALMAMMF